MTDKNMQAEPVRVPVQGQPGARLIAGRYLLRGELGRGGMGVVWQAEDRVIGRQVAVKEMRLAHDVDAELRAQTEERILREARSAGRLNDPAVVTVFDVVHDSGSVFIVMELIEAPTLTELVRERGPLDSAFVADLGRQVLAALEAAHAAGVVHRDVKPSNIMVLPSGRPKLTDFGIAQAADDPTLTKTGMVIGSPAYLAPERFAGRGATAASDLWSLGAVLFFAVEGRSAFERDSTAATLNAVINEVPYLTRCQVPLAAAISGLMTAAPEGRLVAAQVRSLLDAAARDTARIDMNQTSGFAARTDPTVALPFAGGKGDAAAPRRPRGKLFGSVAAVTVLALGGALLGGYSMGKSHEKKADTPPSSAVQVFTFGGPTADFNDFGLTSGEQCGSGQTPLRKGVSYTLTDCSKPHDVELYAWTRLADESFDQMAADSNTNSNTAALYPGAARIAAAAADYCYLQIPMSKNGIATPKTGSTYSYAALVASQNNWTGTHLPKDGQGRQDIMCVMWNNVGQLPAETSS